MCKHERTLAVIAGTHANVGQAPCVYDYYLRS